MTAEITAILSSEDGYFHAGYAAPETSATWMTGDTGVLWSLDIPITPPLTGPVKSPLVFK